MITFTMLFLFVFLCFRFVFFYIIIKLWLGQYVLSVCMLFLLLFIGRNLFPMYSSRFQTYHQHLIVQLQSSNRHRLHLGTWEYRFETEMTPTFTTG